MFVDPWLPRAAAVAPDRVAVQTPAGSWTYTELLTTARDGAGWLAQRGVGAGHRVAIALPPGLGFVQALHAVMWLGAVAVPIDPRLTAAERERLGRGAAAVVEQPLWEGPSPGGSAGPAGSAARLDLEAAAVIVHTSGTTAAPRPVSLTYGNFLWSALGSAVALGLDPDERWLCAMPVSHVGGLSILLRSVIYATTAVVHERFEPCRTRTSRSCRSWPRRWASCSMPVCGARRGCAWPWPAAARCRRRCWPAPARPASR